MRTYFGRRVSALIALSLLFFTSGIMADESNPQLVPVPDPNYSPKAFMKSKIVTAPMCTIEADLYTVTTKVASTTPCCMETVRDRRGCCVNKQVCCPPTVVAFAEVYSTRCTGKDCSTRGKMRQLRCSGTSCDCDKLNYIDQLVESLGDPALRVRWIAEDKLEACGYTVKKSTACVTTSSLPLFEKHYLQKIQ